MNKAKGYQLAWQDYWKFNWFAIYHLHDSCPWHIIALSGAPEIRWVQLWKATYQCGSCSTTSCEIWEVAVKTLFAVWEVIWLDIPVAISGPHRVYICRIESTCVFGLIHRKDDWSFECQLTNKKSQVTYHIDQPYRQDGCIYSYLIFVLHTSLGQTNSLCATSRWRTKCAILSAAKTNCTP
jgi:hypothetical protein